MTTPLLSEKTFNYVALKEYLEEWGQEELKQMFSDRKKSYREAVKILNKIADDSNLTKSKFIDLLEQLVVNGYWHSGKLYRRRRFIYPSYKKFAELVRFIRDNKSEPSNYIFDKAKELVKNIEGASINYVT